MLVYFAHSTAYFYQYPMIVIRHPGEVRHRSFSLRIWECFKISLLWLLILTTLVNRRSLSPRLDTPHRSDCLLSVKSPVLLFVIVLHAGDVIHQAILCPHTAAAELSARCASVTKVNLTASAPTDPARSSGASTRQG